MMDEYERATVELKNVLGRASEEQFNRIVDTETKDEDCCSIQTSGFRLPRVWVPPLTRVEKFGML